jgi:hypothetical protein
MGQPRLSGGLDAKHRGHCRPYPGGWVAVSICTHCSGLSTCRLISRRLPPQLTCISHSALRTSACLSRVRQVPAISPSSFGTRRLTRPTQTSAGGEPSVADSAPTWRHTTPTIGKTDAESAGTAEVGDQHAQVGRSPVATAKSPASSGECRRRPGEPSVHPDDHAVSHSRPGCRSTSRSGRCELSCIAVTTPVDCLGGDFRRSQVRGHSRPSASRRTDGDGRSGRGTRRLFGEQGTGAT